MVNIKAESEKRQFAGRPSMVVRGMYVALIRPHVSDPLIAQRLKLLWYGWGYLPLFRLRHARLRDRVSLIKRFLIVDWHVVHAHTPTEIACICAALAQYPPGPNEIVLEAGCWQGGSSAKFSIICKQLGYRLWIYDSFEGVEAMSDEDRSRGYDFSGSYSSPRQVLAQNLARYGEPDVCTIHSGWFSDTLAGRPVSEPIKLAYIDCDLVKGTKEALSGIVPSLARHAVVFSQDCHLPLVFATLRDPATWAGCPLGPPVIERSGVRLASVTFSQDR